MSNLELRQNIYLLMVFPLEASRKRFLCWRRFLHHFVNFVTNSFTFLRINFVHFDQLWDINQAKNSTNGRWDRNFSSPKQKSFIRNFPEEENSCENETQAQIWRKSGVGRKTFQPSRLPPNFHSSYESDAFQLPWCKVEENIVLHFRRVSTQFSEN